MTVKYTTTINNTISDDFLLLGNEIELKGMNFQHYKMNLSLLP